jgi:N-methylhydantoinase A/oxoprolinase/acetone carboxylase beta subunit
MSMRLSADIGGTFTDVAAFDETTGEMKLGKALCTCVYGEPKPARCGDEVRQGWGGI